MDTQTFNEIFDAVTTSNWRALAALGVVAFVWAGRTYGAKKIPWLGTDRGGSVLALLTGIAGGLANAWLAGKPVDLSLVVQGLQTGVLASGGYVMTRRLLWPEQRVAISVPPSRLMK